MHSWQLEVTSQCYQAKEVQILQAELILIIASY